MARSPEGNIRIVNFGQVVPPGMVLMTVNHVRTTTVATLLLVAMVVGLALALATKIAGLW